MKILLPYYDNSLDKIDMTIFLKDFASGGAEWFCKKLYNSYKNEIELFLLETEDVQSRSKKQEIIKKIKLKAEEVNADIMISNFSNGCITGASMMDIPIPIMYINHAVSPMMSSVVHQLRLKQNNHSVFLVNEYQKNYYDAYSKRLKQTLIDFDGYVEPSYVEGIKPKLQDNPEYDCITVGRCNPDTKKPYLLKSLLKNTNYKTLLMTNISNLKSNIKFDKMYQYYLKNKHWDNCLYDLSHTEVLNQMLNGKSYFMTCPVECFPITGLEALSRGLPLIINTVFESDGRPSKRVGYKEPSHGANCWALSKNHYVNINQNSSEELINAIENFKNIDRQEISDSIWETYTHKRWKSLLDNAIDKTIENFKNKSSLSSFFT